MKTLLLISTFFILQVYSCRREYSDCPASFLNKSDDRITITNNASNAITYTFSYEYPKDTSFLEMSVPTSRVIDANPNKNIAAGKSGNYVSGSCWESIYKHYIPSGKLRITVFEIDSVKALPVSEIISRGLYKSYLYTLEELKSMNWQFVYP